MVSVATISYRYSKQVTPFTMPRGSLAKSDVTSNVKYNKLIPNPHWTQTLPQILFAYCYFFSLTYGSYDDEQHFFNNPIWRPPWTQKFYGWRHHDNEIRRIQRPRSTSLVIPVIATRATCHVRWCPWFYTRSPGYIQFFDNARDLSPYLS